jgi:hypothetical protein
MSNQAYAEWLSNLSNIRLEQERQNVQWVIDFGVAKTYAESKMSIIKSEIKTRVK